MNILDDVRKTVSNPKPLYFAAGVGDAAVTALRDTPALLNGVSAIATETAAKVATRVAGAAETVQSKLALGQLDPKAIRERIAEPDLRVVREKAQTLALMQVGRALEVAGKAVETYDGYSERGKAVVERFSGRNGTEVEVVSVTEASAAPAPAPAAEAVVVDEAVAEPAPAPQAAEPKAAEPKAAAEPKTETKAEAKTTNNTRKATTPRRKPAAPKA